ncbi:hypothetical protein [Xylophilus sp. GOD-11R]|uniref:hypothetical protein n=1 Tax=Xylophilus sp. GOD-11R TaxID=3089814 RepID=UPI00298C5C8A|nr:hypothetical protein [Xylophilus sp. GOD-11R]WPB59315.1 hypothetical protein R9X41_11990 [Xylophilus sp. GOD-11R]
MRRHVLTSFLFLAAIGPTQAAFAQSAAAAQQIYQQQMAACDPAQPRPAYNACIRAAGTVLDRSGATSSGATVNESSDGRATILQPPGLPVQSYPPSSVVPETTTSQDGRATLLVPSDSVIRPGP